MNYNSALVAKGDEHRKVRGSGDDPGLSTGLHGLAPLKKRWLAVALSPRGTQPTFRCTPAEPNGPAGSAGQGGRTSPARPPVTASPPVWISAPRRETPAKTGRACDEAG